MYKNSIYLYNPHQTNYLLAHDCKMIETGYGKKGDVYWKFVRNEHTEEILTKWRLRER